MHKKILMLLLFVFWTVPAFAQDTLWSRTYGGSGWDYGWFVQQTTDGGYIVTGRTRLWGAGSYDVYLIKTNSTGDTLWTRTYGGSSDDYGYSVQQTTDGGYIVTGVTWSFGAGVWENVYLIKTDSLGNTLWTRTYGGNGYDWGTSVQQTTDGGYIVAGWTFSFGAGVSDVYLIKTDSTGDTLWTRTYGGSQYDDGWSVQQTTDGGYIVSAKTYSSGDDYDVYLIKTDSTGDTLWTRTYGGSSLDYGFPVQQTTDGGYIVAGWTESFGAGNRDVYLIKTDSLGDTLWTRTCGGSYWERGSWAQQTTDGGYIVSALTYSFGAGMSDVYLIKTDSTGDTLWTRTYGGSQYDDGYSVQQTTDGGYIVAGWTESFGAGNRDVYLIKTDSTGDTLWTRTYGGSQYDEGWFVQQTTDGGYIVAGVTESFGAGGYDVVLTKLDSLGNTCIGEFVSSTVMSVSPTVTSPPMVVTSPATIVTSPTETVTSPATEVHIVCTTQPPSVISTSPAQNELNVPVSANISVTFDLDMDETTINDSTFLVNARSTGLHLGTITYDGPSRTATFDPAEDFDEGEVVTVALTTGIQSSGGAPLDSAYVWSFTSVVQDGSGSFATHSVYAVGDRPYSVFPADLDGDGDLDLTTANGVSDNVSVLLNNGDGTFAPHSVYPVGNVPYSVFSADLDGDEDLDLAAANQGSGNVSVLLNNGNGTFAPHSVYPVGNSPWSVFSADLDGDGDLDLAVANGGAQDVSVLLNKGDGTFAPQSVYAAGGGPVSVFSADLDGDGDLDLATANMYPDNVSVLLNNGDGTFAPHSVYPAGTTPRSVFSADLDGDGDLDLAVANENSNNVSVLLNNGDGTFAPHSLYSVGLRPRSIFSADLDGDGDLDLAVAIYGSDKVSVLLNNGDGTFATHFIYFEGNAPHFIFSADLDGDGDMDLATSNYDSDNVSVLLNRDIICGDANSDDIVDIGDIVYLVSYCYKGGPAPIPQTCAGDANNDDIVNIGDIVYLVTYCYKGGPAPDLSCCNPSWSWSKE